MSMPLPRKPFGVKTKIKLESIDDVNELINLDVVIAFHVDNPDSNWQVPKIVAGPFAMRKVEDLGPSFFNPKLDIQDTCPGTELVDERILESTTTGTLFIIRKMRVVIRQVLHLSRFPFDRHVIEVKIASFTNFVEWTASPRDTPYLITNDTAWMNTTDLVLYDESDWTLDWTHKTITSEHIQHFYTIYVGVSRNPQYYMTNFVVVICVVVEASSLCVAISPSDFGTRSGLTFTLLLTLIAFKFVMSSMVPKISYMTILDTYNLFAVLALSTVILENFFVSSLFYPDNDDINSVAFKSDVAFAVLFNIIWLALNLFFWIGAYCDWFHEPWEKAVRQELIRHQCGQHRGASDAEKDLAVQDFHALWLFKTDKEKKPDNHHHSMTAANSSTVAEVATSNPLTSTTTTTSGAVVKSL